VPVVVAVRPLRGPDRQCAANDGDERRALRALLAPVTMGTFGEMSSSSTCVLTQPADSYRLVADALARIRQ
jgi:hypothetical protein